MKDQFKLFINGIIYILILMFVYNMGYYQGKDSCKQAIMGKVKTQIERQEKLK